MVFLLRLLINAAALWVAIQLVDGIDHRGSMWSLLFVALVFGVLNASIRPVLQLLSLPLLILTLGLFMFVINALMLMMTGWVSRLLNLGFYVGGFWDAFLGGLIISVVSLMLSIFTGARKMKVHVESRRLHSRGRPAAVPACACDALLSGNRTVTRHESLRREWR